VADYLRQERRPLTQYDVDLLPRFRENSPAEQGWLASLGADVYVPIYAKGEWIGLLALGPKTCGDRYFEEDLALLSTLADQTAVALENARLFDDLKGRNVENEQLNQELAVANRELARLDEAKSNFIDIASHELRTPLTQICGYNEILGEMVEEGSLTADTALQMAQGIHKGAQRLQEIVDLMFDVSQLDTETLILSLAQTQISRIVHGAAESWARALKERRQTLVVEGLESLPALTGDDKRLVQVFSHLVQNAIKYTPDGGHIRITGRLLNGVTEPQERAVEIVVADTGIGIAPDDLGRVFDKFYRAGDVMFHSTGKTKFKGAGPGLGLTIARGIVEAHGGRIWAESLGYDEQTRPGSQFHIVLPVQPHRLESAGLETFIAAVRANTEQINVTV
jgi:signal transduction histidine kinase